MQLLQRGPRPFRVVTQLFISKYFIKPCEPVIIASWILYIILR